MAAAEFFPRSDGKTIAEIADFIGAEIRNAPQWDRRMTGVASLDEARPNDVAFFDNVRYADSLGATRAGCVILSERYGSRPVPEGTAALVTKRADQAFASVGRMLFPMALAPQCVSGETGVSDRAFVDASARLEAGVTVEPFAVIGPGVEIGSGTIIGANATVASGCRIGRDCRIGANVSLSHTLIGNRVIIHPGVRAGQDGFGYVAGPSGLMKTVQIGRVVIQDDVEIGANTTIDRGAIRDTVIGEGTKIDNQVQVAHNVVIGRHCVIVGQVGLSGSCTLGDGVMIGGQSGVNGHVKVGDGAQIAAISTVQNDVPPGVRWGGAPAKPVKEWFREIMTLSELAKKRRSAGNSDE
ncbi:UDP-3-O-[3-hydroxymyristoyl] glucosamine N-acyltransferase [Fulvimarina pelagi HTCC2506]|uniref:UDP-3-O-acylglucosamine N-acyltransferase n=1 Tax=Fulvimarina pelagi HTCC2506 TaxID=314231 RepID=Q0G6E2_9HYPH|nr:UDP-3-O-(3-hydroxymyristoyl)glucosamine N-acyltransferase [Fulvimarina pelagi]EAU42772.1 UDP-3-O-[3-hydroxymyristoyl] glucosamine N-acyltransferase [Fulvimarina pelagi HTCC2506]